MTDLLPLAAMNTGEAGNLAAQQWSNFNSQLANQRLTDAQTEERKQINGERQNQIDANASLNKWLTQGVTIQQRDPQGNPIGNIVNHPGLPPEVLTPGVPPQATQSQPSQSLAQSLSVPNRPAANPLPQNVLTPGVVNPPQAQGWVPKEQGQGPALPHQGLDHPAIAPLIAQASKAGNIADTSSVTDPNNPMPAGVQTFLDGNTQVTVDRAKILQGLKDDGHADIALKLFSQWHDDDLQAHSQKTAQALANANQVGALMYGLENTPDSAKDAYIKTAKGMLGNFGIDASQIPDTYKGNEATFKALETQAQTIKDQAAINQTATENALAKRKQEAAEAAANDTSDFDQKAQFHGDQMNLEWSKLALQKQQAAGTGGNSGKTVASWDDIPATQRGALQQVAEGKAVLNDLFPVSPRKGANVMSAAEATNLITQLVPGWNNNLGHQEKKTLVDFAPNGTSGTALTSLNALADHTALIKNAHDALKNGQFQLVNDIANKIGVATGGDAVTTYRNMLQVYAGEADKFMSGNNPTEKGSEQWQKNLSENLSPTQAAGSFNILTHAIGGKLGAIDQSYHNATSNNGLNPENGKHLDETGLLTEGAKSMFKPSVPVASSPSLPAIKVNPANQKVYYLHSDNKYYPTK